MHAILVDNRLTSSVPLWTRKANGILGHKAHNQEVVGDDPPPILCPGEATSEILCPVLRSPVQEI